MEPFITARCSLLNSQAKELPMIATKDGEINVARKSFYLKVTMDYSKQLLPRLLTLLVDYHNNDDHTIIVTIYQRSTPHFRLPRRFYILQRRFLLYWKNAVNNEASVN